MLLSTVTVDGRTRHDGLLTLFDCVVAVAVGVVGHVSEQRVVRVRVLGAQAVGVHGSVCAASPCEFAWKVRHRLGTLR